MNNLLPLTDNYVFRAVLGKDTIMLLDLLNSFPQFKKEKKIKEIKILPTEILGTKKSNKDTILDIHAEDVSGNIFLIEMQTASHKGFSQRILYNWAKLYSNSLKKGKDYTELPKVYSINFLNFSIVKEYKDYIYNFEIRSKKYPKISLTEDLEIIIVELPKLQKNFAELENLLEYWIYFIRDTNKLEEIEMKTISKKSNGLNRAVKELKYISLDKESRKLHEARLRAERKFQKTIYEKGKEDGLAEGIEKGKQEGLSEGIEKEKNDIALTMLSRNIEIDFIMEVTGLSLIQIKNLQKKQNTKK